MEIAKIIWLLLVTGVLLTSLRKLHKWVNEQLESEIDNLKLQRLDLLERIARYYEEEFLEEGTTSFAEDLINGEINMDEARVILALCSDENLKGLMSNAITELDTP